jgi:hypothetical protein
VKAAAVILGAGLVACGGKNESTIPCGGADAQSLQKALAGLSADCRVVMERDASCVSPQYKECNGFCSGNEVLFCGKPADECSGIFEDQAIDDLLRRSSSARILHAFADGQTFTSFEMDSEADAMALERLVRSYGCDKECLTEVVFRKGRVVVTWPKWKSATDAEPPCFGEAATVVQKWASGQ